MFNDIFLVQETPNSHIWILSSVQGEIKFSALKEGPFQIYVLDQAKVRFTRCIGLTNMIHKL